MAQEKYNMLKKVAEINAQDDYNGKALLYVCAKSAQRSKKDTIQKALKWLDDKFYFNNLHHAIENNTYESMEEMFEDFKKEMEK